MVTQRIGIFFRAAGTTFVPPLIPLLFAALAGLTISGASEFHLSIVVRAGAVTGTCTLRVLDGYISTRLSKKFARFQHSHNTMIGRMIAKLHNKMALTNHPLMLMMLVAGTTYSAIPDILIIRSVRRKLPFGLFLLAVIFGKFFVYTKVIYGVQLIEYFIKTLG